MGRVKSRVEPIRKRPKKQDTPLKSSLSRGIKLKRQLDNKVYEALPEDAEVGHINIPPAKTGVPLMERDSFKGHQTEVDRESEKQSFGSVTPPSLVIDTFYDDDSDDEESSLLDTTSSTLPSPEVFREEHYVESSAFQIDDDLTQLHPPIKNSTLLDLSYAETILMHQPPNLSTIMDAPTILAENTNEISNNRQPIDECKIVKDLNSENKKCKTHLLPSLVVRKPILFKKRVWFRSPLFSDKGRRESIAPQKTISDTELDTEALKVDENNLEDRGIFFDFASDAEQDSFFQRMRERCTKLQNAAVFPLTAVRLKRSAVSSFKVKTMLM